MKFGLHHQRQTKPKEEDDEEDKAELVTSVGDNRTIDKAEGFTGANVFSFLTAHAGKEKFDEFDDDLDEALNGDSSSSTESEDEGPPPEFSSSLPETHIEEQSQAQTEDKHSHDAPKDIKRGEHLESLLDQQLKLPEGGGDDGSDASGHGGGDGDGFADDEHEDQDDDRDLMARAPMIRSQSNLMDSIHSVVSKKRSRGTPTGDVDKAETRATALNDKLRQQLGIAEDDTLIGDYPCWLLKEILLQGHLYLTTRHVCFFAFLPRIQSTVIKSGSLQKKNRRPGGGYGRYWFILRREAFSYYNSASDLYFPSGVIDLRYAIKAMLINKDKDQTNFCVITERRSYTFKSDTPSNAREWVKALQKEIFRSRNEGDTVKIVIPVTNIIDIEESPIMDVASTLKVRAIDSEETYSIDEYVFAFFHRSREVVAAIKDNMHDIGVDTVATSNNNLTVTQNRDRIEHLPQERHFVSTMTTAATRTISIPGTKLKDLASSTIRRTASPHKSLKELKSKVKDLFDSSSSEDETSGDDEEANQDLNSANPVVEQERYLKKMLKHERKALHREAKRERDDEAEISNEEEKAAKAAASRERHIWKRERLQTKANKVRAETANNSSASAQESATQGDESAASPNLRTTFPSEYDLMSSNESTGPKIDVTHHSSHKVITKYPLNVLNKVTEMWGGGRKHFSYEDDDRESKDPKHLVSEEDGHESNERFRQHFSLGESDNLVATYYGYLQKSLPIYGKLYLSTDHLCFRSLIIGTNTKMILPLVDVENVVKEKGFRFGYSGLVVVVHGHEEIFFEFGQSENRDDCEVMVLREIDHARTRATSLEVQGHEKLFAARLVNYEDALEKELNQEILPIIADPDIAKEKQLLPTLTQKLHITFLTIGSRGDVQPYLAIGRGLIKEGHTVRIATHAEFKDVVEEQGCEFREVAGDPGQLMQIMIEHGMFSVSFLRDAAAKFRDWITELLDTSWKACQGTDLLIESPSAMAGIHIAEALSIPYMRAFTMPWTRTRAYPHAFIVPDQKMGGSYNYLTYVLFDNVFWKGISGQVNKWRKNTLNLPRTSLDQMQQTKTPFLYNVSPNVLVPPVDYADWVHVTGYWFLDEKDDYKPDQRIVDFIKKAREDKKKIVYIGFGSIVVSNPKEMTEAVIESVQKADVRCVLVKGWSDRMDKKKEDAKKVEVPLPDEICQVDSVPHDWLFPQIDAAVHHGGSGTTGASLRAGLPTIIKPFFGDQFFYAGRVEDLGVGIYMQKLNVTQFTKTLKEVCQNERIIHKAKEIGNRIRNEHGVQAAISAIFRDLDYAKRLAKEKTEQNKRDREGCTGMTLNPLNLVRGRSNSSVSHKSSAPDTSPTLAGPAIHPHRLLEVADELEEENDPNTRLEKLEQHDVKQDIKLKRDKKSIDSITKKDQHKLKLSKNVPNDTEIESTDGGKSQHPRVASSNSTTSDDSWDIVE